MKKTLTAALGTTFLLGFAASAFAIHGTVPAEQSVVAGKNAKITLDGKIRSRGYSKSTTTVANSDGSTAEGYDSTVQLGVKAVLSDEASGYIHLETGSGSGDTYNWDGAAGLNTGGSKRGSMEINQAWINYDPGMVGVKVGHMPLALNNKQFFDHTTDGDDAIVVYMDPSSNTHIGLLTIKFNEGNTSANDDIDGYVALLMQKMGASNLGVSLTNLNRDGDVLDMYNLGIDFGGKFGPVALKAGLDYQMGDDGGTFTGGTPTAQHGFAGYAVVVDGSMDAGAVKVGAVLGYGTGDGDATDTDQEKFINFLSDVRYYSTMVGYILQVPGAASKNTGLQNMLLVQVNGAGKITDDISWKARVNYMTLNEVAVGADDDLGIELEGFLTWKLSNGLSYGIEAAYLLTGDAWKTTPTAEVDDVWFLRHSLTLDF
ncbi:MAG: hypothetical protein KKE17_07010 [Proteobacteria bacterium]|nr:hypothetical protein [Pseudomonadota bacterium]MBU1709736.1 hypothetical protein [Pseudomonadota bacterium]